MECESIFKQRIHQRLESLIIPTWQDSNVTRTWLACGGLGDLLPFGSAERDTIQTRMHSRHSKIHDLINLLEEELRLSRYDDAQLSPPRNLPPEILSKILIYAKPADFRITAFAHKPEFPALAVCKRWREIAFGTMPLWSTIDFTFIRQLSQKQCFDHWSESRASLIMKSFLLFDVTTDKLLSGIQAHDIQFLSSLFGTMDRWKCCTHFYHGDGSNDAVLKHLGRATSLKVLKLRSEPSGPPLPLGSATDPSYGNTLSPSPISLDNLVDLDIQGSLSLSRAYQPTEGLSWLSNFVNAPQLQSLTLTMENWILTPERMKALALAYNNLQTLKIAYTGCPTNAQYDFDFPQLREFYCTGNARREFSSYPWWENIGWTFMSCISRSAELHCVHLNRLELKVSPTMPNVTELNLNMTGSKELAAYVLTAYPTVRNLTMQHYRGNNDILERLLLHDTEPSTNCSIPCPRLEHLSLKSCTIHWVTLLTLAKQRSPAEGTGKLRDQRVARCTMTLESVYDDFDYHKRCVEDVRNGDASSLALKLSA